MFISFSSPLSFSHSWQHRLKFLLGNEPAPRWKFLMVCLLEPKERTFRILNPKQKRQRWQNSGSTFIPRHSQNYAFIFCYLEPWNCLILVLFRCRLGFFFFLSFLSDPRSQSLCSLFLDASSQKWLLYPEHPVLH